jgi:hypothetical protein
MKSVTHAFVAGIAMVGAIHNYNNFNIALVYFGLFLLALSGMVKERGINTMIFTEKTEPNPDIIPFQPRNK